MPGLFITGTDTGVGKTLVATALLHVLRDLGLRAAGMKPIAAGAERVGDAWVNDDVARIRAVAGVEAAAELVNPYLFRAPIAPHIAAEQKGVRIEIARIVEAYAALAAQAEWVVVEGVGGFRVPLDDRHDTADLAVALGLPIVMVVGMRQGCLNHALLSAEAIAARGLRLAGWVANPLDPAMAVYRENLAALGRRLSAPCLAELPWLAEPDAARAARAIAPARLTKWLKTLTVGQMSAR